MVPSVRVLLPLYLDRLGTVARHVTFKLVLKLTEGHAQHRFEIADESIDVALARDLVDDVLVVVVPQTAAQLLVVHLGFVLPCSPPSSDLLRIDELKFPLTTRPSDAVLTVTIGEQLKKKLPKLDGPGTRRIVRTDLRGGAWAGRVAGGVEW